MLRDTTTTTVLITTTTITTLNIPGTGAQQIHEPASLHAGGAGRGRQDVRAGLRVPNALHCQCHTTRQTGVWCVYVYINICVRVCM